MPLVLFSFVSCCQQLVDVLQMFSHLFNRNRSVILFDLRKRSFSLVLLLRFSSFALTFHPHMDSVVLLHPYLQIERGCAPITLHSIRLFRFTSTNIRVTACSELSNILLMPLDAVSYLLAPFVTLLPLPCFSVSFQLPCISAELLLPLHFLSHPLQLLLFIALFLKHDLAESCFI